MPTLDEMTLNGPEVHEQIVRQLHRLDQNIQATGFGPMLAEELRGAYEKIKTVVGQLVSQKGQSTPRPGAPQGLPPPPTAQAPQPVVPTRAPAPAPNLPLSTFAEGGLISDSSGRETERIRNQLGIR